jgi:hypothetical protein
MNTRLESPLSAHLRRATLVLGLATLGACSRGRANQNVSPDQQALIVFTNESLAQADVFAVAPGISARRIGTVMAGRTDSLTVPSEITMRGTVRLVARLLASSATPGSGTVAIRPGDRLDVRLPIDQRSLVVLPGS